MTNPTPAAAVPEEWVVCPKCGAKSGAPCTTGGYLPVGDLPGDVNPDGPHRQRKRAAADLAPLLAARDARVRAEALREVEKAVEHAPYEALYGPQISRKSAVEIIRSLDLRDSGEAVQ